MHGFEDEKNISANGCFFGCPFEFKRKDNRQRHFMQEHLRHAVKAGLRCDKKMYGGEGVFRAAIGFLDHAAEVHITLRSGS
jgi:hypothetical protein